MKTLKQTTVIGLLLITFLMAFSCSKDENPEPEQETQEPTDIEESDGATLDELETYLGSLGIRISVRDIAKKGHVPTTAIITAEAPSETLSETITIDQDTHIGQYTLEIADISETLKDELEDGVPINVEIRGSNNSTLLSQDFSIISFMSNPNNTEIDATSLTDQADDVTFRPNVFHYIQIIEQGNNSSETASFVAYNPGGTYGVPIELRDNYTFEEDDPEKNKFQYTFEEIPNEPGSHAIISNIQDGNGMHLFLRMHPSGYLYQDQTRHVETSPLETLPAENRFKIQRTEGNGLYTITPVSNNTPLRKSIVNSATRLNNFGSPADNLAYFRILTPDIDWEIQTLDVKHLTPILPAPSSSFAYNSTLTNCTSGLLTQEIGVEETVTTTSQSSFEESFSMTSRETIGASVTVGVSVETSFFGSGATVSAEATASYETETEMSSTNTQYTSETLEESQTLFSVRTLEVPAGTAAKVYDAYQTYENIKVPFIQRYLIMGTYQTGEGSLTGNEVLTQFSFTNANSGVVTEIGSNYIKLTVRGTHTIGNAVDVLSRADDTDPGCN